MPDNPLSGLKKATGIGAAPLDNLGPVTQDIMPMLPGGVLAGLRNAVGSGLGDVAETAPRASVPQWEASHRAFPVQETLGESHPDFTPVGGEGLFNVAKQGLHDLVDPAYAAYLKLLGQGGR